MIQNLIIFIYICAFQIICFSSVFISCYYYYRTTVPTTSTSYKYYYHSCCYIVEMMKCQVKVMFSFSSSFLYSGEYWQKKPRSIPTKLLNRHQKQQASRKPMSNQTTSPRGEVVLVLPTGAERFSANIRDMTGYSPLPVFKLCWKYLTPAVCTVSDPSLQTCFHTVQCLLAVKQYTHKRMFGISYKFLPGPINQSTSHDIWGLSMCVNTDVIPVNNCCLQATFMFSLIHWSPLSLGKGLVAPTWAITLGWLLTLSSVSLLPIWAIYALATTPGSLPQVTPL